MTKEFELIVFDWDGTLMDSQARIVDCMRLAIADLGFPERSVNELRNIIGLGLREAMLTLYPQSDQAAFDALVSRYREHFLYTNDTPSELFAGVIELLSMLVERGHYLAIATGKGRQGLDKVLDETGVRGYFHVTRCADECHSKPHPQMLDEIMDYLGVESSRSLMIGDTEYDLQMATHAGTHSLAVSYGAHEKDRLLACQPLACVDTIAELHQWLLTNTGAQLCKRSGTDA